MDNHVRKHISQVESTEKIIRYTYSPDKSESSIGDNVYFMTEDSDGLYIFNPANNTSLTYLHSENDLKSIGSNSITSIKKDKAGNMWLGTTNAGLCVTKPGANLFKHYKHTKGSNSLSNNIVNMFFEDSAKNIWIATDGGGLNKFNEQSESFEVFKHQPNNPQSIAGDYSLTMRLVLLPPLISQKVL